MILDSLKSFEKYTNLHASFGKVLDFIRKNDLHTLPEGKHVIEEDNIWCTISTARCNDESEEEPEAYISYGDDNMVICFPQDCHAPLIGDGEVRKAVFKVRF